MLVHYVLQSLEYEVTQWLSEASKHAIDCMFGFVYNIIVLYSLLCHTMSSLCLQGLPFPALDIIVEYRLAYGICTFTTYRLSTWPTINWLVC